MPENLELPQKDLNTENFIHPIRGNMVYSHLALFASLGDCSSRNPMTGMGTPRKEPWNNTRSVFMRPVEEAAFFSLERQRL